MYKRCWILLHGIFYIGVIDVALSQQKGLDKSVNLALETVFEFDKDGKSDIQLLNNVQKFIGKVKNVLEKKHIERRHSEPDQRNVFTKFVLNIVNVLNKFEDDDLERFFGILGNEMKRYCDKEVDFHILKKLSLVRNMPANILRQYFKAIANKIEEQAYLENEKAVIDGVNYIFKQDDTTKYDKFINNLDEFRRKSRRNINLVQVVKTALQNIFLKTYYGIEPTAKTVLRNLLNHYFSSVLSIEPDYPFMRQTKGVNRAKSKTTREFRTWRQMYVEKNLDLKYPTDIYIPVTEKHEEKRTLKISRLLPTTRATTESRHHKITKHGKVSGYNINTDTSKDTDSSDQTSSSGDETTIIRTTKMDEEVFYKRGIYNKNSKPSNQYENSKEYNVRAQEDKYNTERKNSNKLSTFYLDLDKASATGNDQQRSDTTRAHEYVRPVGRPKGFTFGIKYGKQWNSHQKSKKIKHYGYIQNQRPGLFVKKRQMDINSRDLGMARMPPISLNMQLSVTKDRSPLGNGFGDTKHRVRNMYSPRSEEGLSIEGFQETKRTVHSRRSDSHNDTVNNHVLNLIQKLEQDLEAVKTKIHDVSVLRNEMKFLNITEVTENNSNNTSSPAKKVIFESTGVSKVEPNYIDARKTINDQKWHPVDKAHESNSASNEIIIQHKHEPLKIKLTNKNKDDSEINKNVPFSNDSSTKYGITYTTTNSLIENAINENLQNTTIMKVSHNTENGTNLNYDSKLNLRHETFYNNKSTIKPSGDATLQNKNINVVGDKTTNKQNIQGETNKIIDEPELVSQTGDINNLENVTSNEITTVKSDTKTASVTNYKNTTDSAVIDITQKLTHVASNENKLDIPAIKEIERRHIEINNKSIVTMPSKLDKIQEISTTVIHVVKKSLYDKTS